MKEGDSEKDFHERRPGGKCPTQTDRPTTSTTWKPEDEVHLSFRAQGRKGSPGSGEADTRYLQPTPLPSSHTQASSSSLCITLSPSGVDRGSLETPPSSFHGTVWNSIPLDQRSLKDTDSCQTPTFKEDSHKYCWNQIISKHWGWTRRLRE